MTPKYLFRKAVLAAFWFGVMAGAAPSAAQPLRLVLPTENDALFQDDGPAFYQYTDRTFKGRRSRPWQGGQYGFVRNPKETGGGLVYTRFHEGIDVKPMRRDRRGDALDPVRAIDGGRVAYVNREARRSNYGLYVVVEHRWSGSPFYSLYAHLSRVDVEAGQEVAQGAPLGRVGHTGRGIDRRRAHLHFEVGMLISRHFERWFDEHYPTSENHHGVFSGLNLKGLDVAALYLALRRNETLTIGRFVTGQEAHFTITVPREGSLDLLTRYPWLLREGPREGDAAWEIAFTRGGVPVGVTPVAKEMRGPAVALTERARTACRALTNGLLTGRGARCTLTSNGKRYLDLLTILDTRERSQPGW